MYLKLTINAMVATPFSRTRVECAEKGEPLHLFIELAMDRSKTAQDEPAIHRHCHNFRPLDHNAIPPFCHFITIPPFRHSSEIYIV